MSSILTKARKVGSKGASIVRQVANPLQPLQDAAVSTVLPGAVRTEKELLNPFSTLNQNIARAAADPTNLVNPLAPLTQANQVIKTVVTSTVTPTAGAKEQKIIPDRAGYSQSAGTAASEAAKRKAAAERQASQKALSEAAAANESARQKARAEGEARLAAEKAAVKAAEEKNATGSTATAASDAAAITSTMSTGDQLALINALLSAREAAAMEQTENLPEVEVKSDFGKYLLIGGGLLLAFYLLKKKK